MGSVLRLRPRQRLQALRYVSAPVVLNHQTSTGGTDVGSTGTYTTIFFGVPGYADAVYIVKRHDVQKSITYSAINEAHVWGRGVATTGASIESPNYGLGWCDAVPGTVTSTSATLRTYCYEVWNEAGQWIGWYPTTPQNVVYAYTVWGLPTTLSSGHIGPGVWHISSSTTVPAGTTVYIDPGATLQFASGTGLTVSGTLNAVGTSSQMITFERSATSGTWAGIHFNAGSGGTVQYCNINNASTGIYLYSTSMHVYNNDISGLGTYGIDCESYSSPYIYFNTIKGNSSAGLCCNYYSSPYFLRSGASGDYSGYNVIKQNGTGVVATNHSYPLMGISAGYFWKNSICDNSGYEVVAAGSPGTIYAQDNWWNRPSYPYYNLSDFWSYNGQTTFSVAPAWPYDPNPGRSATMAEGNPQIASGNLKVSKAGAASDGAISSGPSSSSGDELERLIILEIEEKYDDAISGYEQIYKKATGIGARGYLLTHLANCYERSGRRDFLDYLNSQVRPDLSKDDSLYATTIELENMFLIKERQYDKAIENFKLLKKGFSKDKETVKNALFNLVNLYYYQLDDKVNGKKCFDELKATYPESEVTWKCKLMFGEIDSIPAYARAGWGKEDAQAAADDLTSWSGLSENYPNPFNPTTTITYRLPNSGNVELKVYDVLGREVATLVSGFQEAGVHTAYFNGQNLASGVYFYRLTAPGINQVKKMLMVK